MKDEIKDVISILEQIAELNEMIGMHKENKYMHDQFLNNKAGFVQELQKALAKFDIKVDVATDDLP